MSSGSPGAAYAPKSFNRTYNAFGVIALPLYGRAGERLQLRCKSGAVRGQKLTATRCLRLFQKIKTKKILKMAIS